MGQHQDILLYVLNGPNLNLLGTRAPEIYGTQTLQDIEGMLAAEAKSLAVDFVFYQSNHEGQLIDWIHEARLRAHGIMINAGAYTHTSIALRDALEAVQLPTVEVHLSDIHAREEYRQKSFISEVAFKMICGKGAKGYKLALHELVNYCRNTSYRTRGK